MNSIAFGILSALLVLSALGVVLNRNPVRSAMCLVGALFLLAVTFVFLDAHMVAALQIIVYTGAIMVLFLFVIMLLNLQHDPQEQGGAGTRAFTVVASIVFTALIVTGLLTSGGPKESQGIAKAASADFGTAEGVSELLFTQFLLPFEITSLLLLIAVVGAVVVAKKKLE